MKIVDVVIENQDYQLLPPANKQKDWLIELGGQLKELDNLKQLSMMCQCKILYWVRKHWDNVDNEVKGFWDYDYYHWASTFTQNDSVNNPASSTIDNKIGVYKDYIAEPCIQVPKTVKVRKTDISGNPVGDGTKEDDFEEIIPNLMWGNYTKLLHAKKPAKEGLMTDDLWSMVFDSTKSVKSFLKEVKELPTADLRIIEKDGLVIAYNSEGDSAILTIVNFDDYNNPLWREGIAKLLKPYSHTMELDV